MVKNLRILKLRINILHNCLHNRCLTLVKPLGTQYWAQYCKVFVNFFLFTYLSFDHLSFFSKLNKVLIS